MMMRRGIATLAKDVSLAKEKVSIKRHSVGDAVITLDVGGKEFKTLRSTCNSNPVLWSCVERAERNSEFTSKGAVFIDRDPTHFSIILSHLRNRSDSLSSVSQDKHSTLLKVNEGDLATMQEIFLEAKYFQVKEIEALTCGTGFMTNVFRMLNIASNPFDAVDKLVKRTRTLLLSIGTTGFALASVGLTADILPEPIRQYVPSFLLNLLKTSPPVA